MGTTQCNADFHGEDFHEEDFLTDVPAYNFRNRLFEKLPTYFKVNDNYKDAEGKGLLERYLYTFGSELDYEVIPKIECYLGIIDAQETPEKFINHLSDSLGNPPDVFNNLEIYRNLLTYIVTFYKIKGTKESYVLLFSILGFDIILDELPNVTNENYYDNQGRYDEGTQLSIYDNNRCNSCSFYDLTLIPKDSNNVIIDDDFIDRIKKAIEFIEPINAKLRNLSIGLNFNDTIEIDKSKDLMIITDEEVVQYDIPGNKYDDTMGYDLTNTIDTGITESLMQVEVTDNLIFGLQLKSIIPLIPVDVNYDTSSLTLKGYNDLAEEIYSIDGTFNSVVTVGLNKEAIIIQPFHDIPNLNTLRLIGNILSTDGLTANIDEELSLVALTNITLSFSI